MDDIERYLFDLQGYLVVPGALDPAEVARLNDVFDGRGGGGADRVGRRLQDFLEWDEGLLALIDQERTFPYVEELCGFGARLDHYYALESVKGADPHTLHLGGTPHSPVAAYHVKDSRISCGLLVVTYALVDHPEGGGGFACIPGSHKSAFACPPDFRRFDDGGRAVRQVALRAGDAVIFTEALTHGALGWSNEHDRRALLFKYAPGHLAWDDAVWPDSLVERCTDRQQLLLQRPCIASTRVPQGAIDRRIADTFGATTY